jgi:hypothetical protein
MEDEDLRLVRKPTERRGVDDAVAVAAEGAARRVWRLRKAPPAACARIGRIWRACRRLDRHGICSIEVDRLKLID